MGQPNGQDLGTFSAQSIYNLATQVSYASRGVSNSGSAIGTIADNVGNTRGPMSGVPEPASMISMGGGLIGLALLVRRKRRSL